MFPDLDALHLMAVLRSALSKLIFPPNGLKPEFDQGVTLPEGSQDVEISRTVVGEQPMNSAIIGEDACCSHEDCLSIVGAYVFNGCQKNSGVSCIIRRIHQLLIRLG